MKHQYTPEMIEDFLNKCNRFWIHDDTDMDRICRGVMEEFGEFLGKEKKEFRQDDADHKEAKVLELGDALFYTVKYMEINNLGCLETIHGLSTFSSEVSGRLLVGSGALGILAHGTGGMSYDVEEEDALSFLTESLAGIQKICYELQVTVKEVMDKNAKKLEERNDRGNIKGSGDDR